MQSITIRVSDELKHLITEEAQKKGQTQSNYLRQLIETQVGQVNEEPVEEVSLSKVERKTLALVYQLFLSIQGDLPSGLYDKESFRQSAEAFECGYEGEYHHIFAGEETGLSYDECRLVWDILDMFRVIKFSVDTLGQNGWQQTGVVNAERHGTFRGFDGQVDLESRLSGYVKFLVRTGRWEEQKEILAATGGNSHRKMLPTYRSMLAVFKPTWRKVVNRGGRYHLNLEEIRSVLMASPSARLENEDILDD